MASLDFRSDVSMQDVDVPELVLFYLVPKPSTVAVRLPVPAPFLQKVPSMSEHVLGNQFSTTAFKLTCRQDVPLDQPVLLLSIGSDPNQCDLVLDRRHADPVHCQIYAQLNSGFDVWLIEDTSRNGTLHRRLKDGKDRENIEKTEDLHTEELIHRESKAIQGLRCIRIGPYEFYCRPSKDQKEIAEREQWFRRHEPIPATAQMLTTQLGGRELDIQERKNIGEGGFGEVFKSMEMHTGLLVAVKKQKVGSDRGVRNVYREIRSMEDLHHRNVVKILHSYEADQEKGQRVFHLVMPLYPCSLRNALPMMRFESKRNAMIQMVEGLQYIHRNGFLHRDIKPENIFISERTPTNIVLGDLGLLSPVGAIGRNFGTNIYKAPEVYYDLRQTASIDIYALGITLLQMVDSRAIEGGWQGLKKWVEDLWNHPPPSPFSGLVIQMTAPYPHTLRPSLDTIQRFLLQNKDLPESVERPQLNLKETMKMLEQEHALSARISPWRPRALPIPQPGPLQNPIIPVKPRLDLHLYEMRASDKSGTNRAGPLDVVHRARGLAAQGPFVPVPRQLRSPALAQDLPDAVQKRVRGEINQHVLTGGVDFTKARVESGNIFTKQKIELLETQLKAKERDLERRTQELEKKKRRLAEEVRAYRRERGHRQKASGPRRGLCPGEWPSQPMYSGAGSFSRNSQSVHDTSLGSISALTSRDLSFEEVSHGGRGIARRSGQARARAITQARHSSERISKRTNTLLRTKMLQRLTLAVKARASGIGMTLSKGIRWMLGI